jgi:hypothetical protein
VAGDQRLERALVASSEGAQQRGVGSVVHQPR